MFIPVKKVNVLKRTDTYLLIKLSDKATAIVSAKFIRQKEGEDCIYLSVPDDYIIKVRFSELSAKSGRYEVTGEKEVDAWYLRKCLANGDNLPF